MKEMLAKKTENKNKNFLARVEI